MGRIDKMKNRLLSQPSDYTYSEAKTLLQQLGYQEYNKGKTSGSRVKFFNPGTKSIINLHKPHPGDVMKVYAVKQLLQKLQEEGEL